MQTFRTSKHREEANEFVERQRARWQAAIARIQPDYRLCRWCGIVWNLGINECPLGLRSDKEIRFAREEARRTA